jgi:hypothetical protein
MIKKKKFELLIFLISLVLLIYTIYKSEFYWSGEKRDYYLIYYIFSLTLIVFSFLFFFINEKLKIYIKILFFSVLFSFYLFEFYITFHFTDKLREQTKFEIFNDMKKKDKNVKITMASVSFLKKNLNIFPLSGVSNSTTIGCNENGYFSIYKSDRYGFNNPDAEWDNGEIEYLLLGDSFTHGSCVNRPDDIASVLRTVSKKSSINLGNLGNGPLIEYATLREFYPKKVNNVLWLYFEGNDILGLNQELKNHFLKNYIKDKNYSQNLKLKQKNVDDIINKIIKKEVDKKNKKKNDRKLIKETHLLNFGDITKFLKFYESRKLFFHSNPVIQPEFKEIIMLANKLAETNGSKFYFVYLPEYKRYKKITLYDNHNYKEIKKILKDLNIPVIDIHTKVFKESNNPLKFFPGGKIGHYNELGYKKTAEAIFNYTEK